MKALVASHLSRSDPLAAITLQTDFPIPQVSGSQVLVQMKTASANPADIMYVDGTYAHAPNHPMPPFPFALGVDGAGIVAAKGPLVSKWNVGDHVLGGHHLMTGGSFAEFGVFDESEVVAKPGNMSWSFAASVPLVWITAMSAFACDPRFGRQSFSRDTPPVQTVMVVGASGGIGSAAVILARHFYNVPNVIAVCSARNAKYCLELGATRVIDYTSEMVEESLAGSKTLVDFTLDNVGGFGGLAGMASNGYYVTNVPGKKEGGLVDVIKFFGYIKWHNAVGKATKLVFNGASMGGSHLQTVVRWLEEHPEMQPLMRVATCSLEDGVESLQVVKSGRSVGKMVLVIEGQ
ncbi:hypothetical protein HDU98_000850 [Podochytrium sp. JEL0797]|nr:hypothetical protein HDU98_000850 [Podochytrium sp. JEL0797]